MLSCSRISFSKGNRIMIGVLNPPPAQGAQASCPGIWRQNHRSVALPHTRHCPEQNNHPCGGSCPSDLRRQGSAEPYMLRSCNLFLPDPFAETYQWHRMSCHDKHARTVYENNRPGCQISCTPANVWIQLSIQA